MPTCQAFGCANTTGKMKDKKTNFYRIPDPKKNRQLCASWLNNMRNAKWNIKNFKSSNNLLVCGDHFHSSCFKRNLKNELCKDHPKSCMKLVDGAIPTIFKHKVYDKINIDGTTVHLKESGSRKRSLELELDLERKDVSFIFFFSVHSVFFFFFTNV